MGLRARPGENQYTERYESISHHEDYFRVSKKVGYNEQTGCQWPCPRSETGNQGLHSQKYHGAAARLAAARAKKAKGGKKLLLNESKRKLKGKLSSEAEMQSKQCIGSRL